MRICPQVRVRQRGWGGRGTLASIPAQKPRPAPLTTTARTCKHRVWFGNSDIGFRASSFEEFGTVSGLGLRVLRNSGFGVPASGFEAPPRTPPPTAPVFRGGGSRFSGLIDSGEVSRGDKMALRGTDLESYITEYTSVYEENRNAAVQPLGVSNSE